MFLLMYLKTGCLYVQTLALFFLFPLYLLLVVFTISVHSAKALGILLTHWSMAGEVLPLGYIQGSGGMSVMVSIIAAFCIVDTTVYKFQHLTKLLMYVLFN